MEWFVDVPWGKVAFISYGDPKNPPVLMVHGYLDSAATFLGLLDYFPDNYYYVAFDIPGHGKSDPFPAGNLPSQIHVVEVMRRVVDHMKWKQFTLLAHSMAYVIGLFYNAVYPNKITKIINLDPLPPIGSYNTHGSMHTVWYFFHYAQYYKNFTRLSWDPKMKLISDIGCSKETLYALMTENIPPTLNLVSTIHTTLKPNKEFAENIMEEVDKTVPHYHLVFIEDSTHDVHCSHPEKIAPHVIEFLNRNSVLKKSHL